MAPMESVQARVTALLVMGAGCDPDEVRPEATLDELGLDSVARTELLGQLEDAFGVYVAPEEAIHLETVGAVVEHVERNAS